MRNVLKKEYTCFFIACLSIGATLPLDTNTAFAQVAETATNNPVTEELATALAKEKEALNTSLKELLTLIQENPNTFPYTDESKTVYTNAVSNAYDPYKNGKDLVDSSTATLEDIKKALADVETQKAAITSAKEAFVERQATSEEVKNYYTLLSQLETVITTPIKTSDKTPTSISAYKEVETRAKTLVGKAKQLSTENILVNDLLKIFQEIKAMKEELLKAQNTLTHAVSQAQQYNPKGKEIIISIGNPLQPLDFIQNAEAITKLPQGTTVNWTYGEPKTDTTYQKAAISITFTYPDGSTDIVPASLTVLSSKEPEASTDSKPLEETTNNRLNNTTDSSKTTTSKSESVSGTTHTATESSVKKATDTEKTKQSTNQQTLSSTPEKVEKQTTQKEKTNSQQFPKTGERNHSTLTLSGSFILITALVGLIKKRNKVKN